MGLPVLATHTRKLRLVAGRTSELDMLDWIPDGVVVADPSGKIVFANDSMEHLTGYRRKELVGNAIELLVPEELRPIHRRHVHRYFSTRGRQRPMGQADRDFRVRRKDGSEFMADIALGPMDSTYGRQTVAVIRDITERRQLETALEHQALHDPLTDLANRTLFFDRLNQALSSANRERKQVALVMLDLDEFKGVNDVYGHAMGDRVLKELSGRLSTGLRATDTAARIGGDEFAWILPRVAGRQAVQRMVRQRLRAFREPVQVDKGRIDVTFSAGAAIYPQDGKDVDTLMRHADSAMYSAKREGRNLAFYGPVSPDRN
jgi:diguanylate cyclase (GGDEF)-like protein/PAS domain S-box-containing protein